MHPGRTLAIAVVAAASYVVSAQVGFRLAFVAEQVTTVWAPAGIAVATLLLFGVRLWPAIWAGAFLANATSTAPLWTAGVIASGNTLEAVAAAWALRRIGRFDPALARVADVLWFVAIGGVLSTAIAASVGVTTLGAAGVQPWTRFGGLWLEWWFGDLLGALIVAPALLTTIGRKWPARRAALTALFVTGSALITHLVFGPLAGFGHHPIEYVIFPLVIAAAVAGGPPATSLVVLNASLVALWHTARGAGPFSGPDPHMSLILLQVFMGVLAATALLLAAAIAERRTSEHRERDAARMLRQREEMLRLAQSAGGVATFDWDFSRQVAQCSAEFFRIFGLPPRDGGMTTAEWGRFTHPDDLERLSAHLARAVQGIEPAAADYRIIAADGTTRWLSYAGELQRTPDGDRMLGTVVDITGRKRDELTLQQAKVAAEDGQRRLAEANAELRRRVTEQQTLLDVLPVGIGIATDPECRTIRTNRALADILGVPLDVNASLTAPPSERPANFRVLTPEGAEVPDADLPMQVAAREGREVRHLEFDIVREDGRVFRLLEYAAPLLDERGVPRGAVGAFIDVTAAHQARATLARSEERYRRMFDTVGVSLWEEDFSAVKAAVDAVRATGVEDFGAYLRDHPEFVDECVRLVKIVDVNPATLRMFRAPDRQALLESLERVFRPETRHVFVGELLALASGQRRYEGEAVVGRLDGRPLDVLVSVTYPGPDESFASVLVSLTDITDLKQAEAALQQEVEIRTALARVGADLAAELRGAKLVETITEVATRLTEAEFGAFFYNVTDEKGDSYSLYSLSGAPREAFEAFPHPRATAVFGPTFRGETIIRLDDVTRDPRYGQSPPYHGMPEGHLPVRSYLAVPVIGRGGEVLGGLFFGHSRPGVFSARHEALAAGVAGWAAIALDNARLYQQAEEANRLKDEFLATLSHELRTPLNAVLGWAHMLREGAMQPSMRERALESLDRNARAQAQLVEDLLDVSRIMAGKLQVAADAVDLGAVVLNSVDTMRAAASAKGIELDVRVPSDARIIVIGDAARLQQVVWNLVSNAIKFTPAGGRVDVSVERAASKAEIVVRDTGQGVAPSFQPFLFERFRQMDSSKTRAHGGLGLGLSIVRHLTEAHGGTVTAESAGEGQGATFRVTLPIRAVRGGVQAEQGDEPPVMNRTLNDLRALVVDDEPDARDLVRIVLESHGAEVVTAASAGEALHLLARERFDVLIADIGMPGDDGLALIRIVRSTPAGSANPSTIPAIAVTAYASVRERDEALAAGFTLHLAKPVDPDRLVAAVSGVQQA